MNISSAIVHAHAENAAAVQARLNAITGVEVHGTSPEGKIIVTIEAEDDNISIDTYTRIGQLEGVLATAMVFNQSEPEPEKEI
jgi:nitrate reductase NapD